MAAITRYHIVDLGNVKAATAAAAALMEYIASPKGLRHMTGLRRAIVWGEGPSASALTMGYLYLSDGALEAVNELRINFTAAGEITADKLPETARLLFGNPA
jgi:hypothetical protein